jgi:hypothetical protein
MSSKSAIEAKANSVTQKLIALGKKKNTSFANLKTAFLIERLVARLVAEPKLRKALVFKGGFVGLRVYENDRYTIDLDALLLKANLAQTLELTKLAAETDLADGVWFRFQDQIDLATQGEYGGIRQIFRVGLGNVLKDLSKAQMVNFDLGIGDPVTPAPVSTTIRSFILDEELSWSIYPVETIIAEKLHAMAARGDANSRSKDVYDLAFFLPTADEKVLREALKKCFEFRKTEVPENFAHLLKQLDTSILEKGWASATVSIGSAPKFKTVFSKMIDLLQAMQL